MTEEETGYKFPPANKFRINAKRFFITFPQCDTPKQEVFDNVKLLPHYQSCIVARELHEDGHPHIHILLICSKELNIRDPRYFDSLAGSYETPVLGNPHKFHANVGSVRKFQACITYTRKSADYLEDNMGRHAQSTRSGSKNVVFQLLRESSSVKEAMDTLLEEDPRSFFLYGSQVSSNLIRIHGTPKPEYTPHSSFTCSFVLPPSIEEWYNQYFTPQELPRRKCLILVGATQLGKTAWARSLGVHCFWRSLFNSDNWHPDAKYLVFDDIEWQFIPNKKQLLTAMGECTITDKYRGKKNIINYKPAIVCCNNMPVFGDDQDYWEANSVIVHIDSPLFSDQPATQLHQPQEEEQEQEDVPHTPTQHEDYNL